MAEPIKMPELGESITEGTITRWLKQEGDQVQADEPLFEVSTDKVDTEVPSPVAGRITSIKVHEDETVAVGTELAEIEPAGAKGSAAGDGQAAAAPAEAEAPAQTPAEAAEAAGAEAEAGGQEPAVAEVAEEPAAAAEAADAGGETVTVRMPELGESITEGTITRWLKQEGDQVQADEPLFEVSTDKVDTEVPSPVAGRITSIKVQEDQTVGVGAELVEIATGAGGGRPARQPVPQAAAASAEAPAVTRQPPARAEAPAAAAPRPAGSPGLQVAVPLPTGVREEVVKATRTRRLIAERMVTSLQVSAQLTAAVEVDMTKVMRLRGQAKDAFKQREGVSLSPLPFCVEAMIAAVRQYPNVNSALDADGNLHVYKDVNLGSR